MKKLLFIFFTLFISLNIYAQANKSVIYLKNGTVIRGVIVEQNDNDIKVKASDGSYFFYNMKEIEHIEWDIIYDEAAKNYQNRLKRGWHGNVELGLGKYKIENNKGAGFNFAFMYGYQINTNLYMGVGTSYIYSKYESTKVVPIYATSRLYLSKKKIAPFLNIKIGENIDYKSFYFSPMIGANMQLTRNTGVSIGLEYSKTKTKCRKKNMYEGGVVDFKYIGIIVGYDF